MVAACRRPDPGPMPETPLPPDSSPDPEHGSGEPTTEAPAADATPSRRLLRSRDDRMIAGVCGGLARYFGIDPVIVRIAAVVLVFFGGASVIAYLAALVLVPEDDGTGRPTREKPSRARTIIGGTALVLAGIALLDNWWGPHWWAFGWLAPVAVLTLLFAVAGARLLRSRGEDGPPAGRIVGAALMLAAAVAGAFAAGLASALVTAAGGGTVIAAIVIGLGVAMVILAFRTSRARWLAVPALVLAIPAGVVSAADIHSDGGAGQRIYQPVTLADLKTDAYKLGAGELRVDLRGTDWPAGATAHVNVDVGVGHALIVVPSDVCVQSAGHAGLGYIGVLGQDSAGADVDADDGTLSRYAGRKLLVNADIGIGAIEVRHDALSGGPGHDRFGSGQSIDNRLADAGCAGARA